MTSLGEDQSSGRERQVEDRSKRVDTCVKMTCYERCFLDVSEYM